MRRLVSMFVLTLGCTACVAPIIDRGTQSRALACPDEVCWNGGRGDAQAAIAASVGIAVVSILGVAVYHRFHD